MALLHRTRPENTIYHIVIAFPRIQAGENKFAENVHIGKRYEFFIGGIWELVLSVLTSSKQFAVYNHRSYYMCCNTCVFVCIYILYCNLCAFIYIYTLLAIYAIDINKRTLSSTL